MPNPQFKNEVRNLLAYAGVELDGMRPFDIQVHSDEFFERVLAEGSLGLGESYMDGWWEVEELDAFLAHVMEARLQRKIFPAPALAWQFLKAKFINRQKKKHAFHIAERHYDLNNKLYRAMLDKSMTYTCAYWKNARDLDKAQEAKLDLVCRKIGLKAGQSVLDIGCGWGSFARFAAENYGASVVGITVSKEQVALGKELCRGLPVEIRLQDYRDVDGQFDHVVSLGMFEHVGPKNYLKFMKIVERCLKDNGLFLLHTIGTNHSVHSIDPWIDKYIFPNAVLPSIKQIATASEEIFVMEDWHNFRDDYDKTLMAWFSNFDRNWLKLRHDYDNRFYRMWKFYLLGCAASFRVGYNQLWQIVFSKYGVKGGYVSQR